MPVTSVVSVVSEVSEVSLEPSTGDAKLRSEEPCTIKYLLLLHTEHITNFSSYGYGEVFGDNFSPFNSRHT